MQLLNDCETHKSLIQCGTKPENTLVMTGAGTDLQFMLYNLGGCPRIENLLRKSPFGQISRSFSLNSHHYSPQMIEKSDQNGFPSLRLLFSDSLLGAACVANEVPRIAKGSALNYE